MSRFFVTKEMEAEQAKGSREGDENAGKGMGSVSKGLFFLTSGHFLFDLGSWHLSLPLCFPISLAV